MNDAKYREYLETLGEDAVRHQLANQMLMTHRGELARAWLAEKVMAREDAWGRYRLIIRTLVVVCGIAAATKALLIITSWIG